MSVRLTHNGLPADITPYRLKLLLQQAKTALGLSSGALKYLEFVIDNCQPSDFKQGRICAIWHSLERLGTVFRLSKRQIGRIEAELVDADLIKRTYWLVNFWLEKEFMQLEGRSLDFVFCSIFKSRPILMPGPSSHD